MVSAMLETSITADELFIVDDDPLINDLLYMTFRSEGYRVTTFSDAETFTASALHRTPICVILDICMPRRSGLEILEDIGGHNYPAPIIIMSGIVSVSIAVEAVKSGAFTIIEKPFSIETIVTQVRKVIDAWTRDRTISNDSESLVREFSGRERLTRRENEVVAEITAGASNKEAGRHLGISGRTIEVHCAHIMKKLHAKNTADLVRITLNKRQH